MKDNEGIQSHIKLEIAILRLQHTSNLSVLLDMFSVKCNMIKVSFIELSKTIASNWNNAGD